MNSDCKQVMEHLNPHRLDSRLNRREKGELRQHLLSCSDCRMEYEETLHTIAVLESLPEPVPPPNLVENIQKRISQERKHNPLAFFANPFAYIFDALKLGPHPTFVNYTAIVFYMVLAIFLVKLTFFGPAEPHRGATAIHPSGSQIRLANVQFGAIKKAAQARVTIEGETLDEATKEPKETPSDTQK
jgi:hypothetical protein